MKSKICKCGHTKSSHTSTLKKGKYFRGECEDFSCNCIKFKLDHFESPAGYPRPIKPDSLIDLQSRIDQSIIEKRPSPQPLKISELDETGKPKLMLKRWVKPIKQKPEFNRGEYP